MNILITPELLKAVTRPHAPPGVPRGECAAPRSQGFGLRWRTALKVRSAQQNTDESDGHFPHLAAKLR